jgi:hypothetical protein
MHAPKRAFPANQSKVWGTLVRQAQPAEPDGLIRAQPGHTLKLPFVKILRSLVSVNG